MNWDDCLQHAAVSDIGMRRTTNQDSYAVVLANDLDAWQRSGHLFIVADGMGAHAAGELASEMAVAGIAHRYRKYQDLSPPEALQRALEETNEEVHQRGQANLDFYNMGTTTSVLALLPQGALIAHVGDSRVYRLRGNTLEQLTFDHSLVWELQASGQLDGDSDLANSVPKNIITRSLGPNASVVCDLEGPFPLKLGDTFLLCSDGLSGLVADEEIGPILASLPPRESAQALTDLANLRGGHDNITVVVVKLTGELLTTDAARSAAVRVPHAGKSRAINPVFWVASGVCFLSAATMALVGYTWPSIVALCIGCATLAAAALRRWLPDSRKAEFGAAHMLGKGPYVRVKCPAGAKIIGKLALLAEQLRSATENTRWTVDLPGFNRLCENADKAAATAQFDTALKEYVHAITFMMNELREQKRRGGG